MYRGSEPSFPSTLEHLITSKRNAKIQQDVGPATCHRRVCFSLVVPQFVAIPMKSCGVVHCRGCHPEPQHLASPPTSLRTSKFIFTGRTATVTTAGISPAKVHSSLMSNLTDVRYSLAVIPALSCTSSGNFKLLHQSWYPSVSVIEDLGPTSSGCVMEVSSRWMLQFEDHDPEMLRIRCLAFCDGPLMEVETRTLAMRREREFEFNS